MNNYDAIVIGATRESFTNQILFGSIPEKIAQAAGQSATRWLRLMQESAAEINPAFEVSLRIEPFKVEHDTILDDAHQVAFDFLAQWDFHPLPGVAIHPCSPDPTEVDRPVWQLLRAQMAGAVRAQPIAVKGQDTMAVRRIIIAPTRRTNPEILGHPP